MLKIDFDKGKYEIKGDLVLENANNFRSYFKTILQHDSKIIVSLKSVTKMDNYVLDVFIELYKVALATNKKFRVLNNVDESLLWILKDPRLKSLLKS